MGFNNHTLRMTPRVGIGGDTLRVRVSNAHGKATLTIAAAYVGIRDKGPAVALPYVEVHMTDPEKRGTRSVICRAARGFVAGLGVHFYVVGPDELLAAIGGE